MNPAPAVKIAATSRLVDRHSHSDYTHRCRPGTDISVIPSQRLIPDLFTGCLASGSMSRLWKRKKEDSATNGTSSDILTNKTTHGSTTGRRAGQQRSIAATPSPTSTQSSDDGKWITNVPMRGGMNEWKLVSILENSFTPEEYKISMRAQHYKVSTPRPLEPSELARLM